MFSWHPDLPTEVHVASYLQFSMVLTFGISLRPYPTNVTSLSIKIPEFRFSFINLLASLHKAGGRDHAKLLFINMVDACKRDWSIKNSADGRGLDPLPSSGDGRTRLIKTVRTLQMRLNSRIRDLRKDFPRKILFFLVGFYCATAFATVIGQTGDWDILSAGLAVAVVEGIGALMYKASVPLLDKSRNLIVMFNYWKAGLTLGLFLDSFKY